jgi:hypothetical protein
MKKMKHLKLKGFTIGLAIIISSSMLIISVSITTLLISDVKNTLINTSSATVYNLAESVLDCAISHDKNIRYFSGSNASNIQDLSGIFPKNLKIFDQVYDGDTTLATYKTPNYDALSDTFTPGYADKNYSISGFDNKSYVMNSIKCLNYSILDNLVPNVTVNVYAPTNAPTYLAQYSGGVITTVNFDKNVVNSYLGMKDACAKLDVYAIDSNAQKLFVSTASMPCGGPAAVQRVLVQYNN